MNSPLITRHLLDNSVLARVQRGEIAPSVLAPYMQGGSELVACTPQMIEALYSTRSPAEWETEYTRRWSHLDVLPSDDGTHDIALEIQRRLWASGKVRAAGTVDVLTAAIAIRHDAVVVHRDSDYERIAEVAPEFRQVRV